MELDHELGGGLLPRDQKCENAIYDVSAFSMSFNPCVCHYGDSLT